MPRQADVQPARGPDYAWLVTPDPRYDPFTGQPSVPGVRTTDSAAARLGLEPPRFCGECGRRMVVQVVPDGWSATCSRHGVIDSAASARR